MTAALLEDLIDACVMESYFREHMAERDLLCHDTVAPHLAIRADLRSHNSQLADAAKGAVRNAASSHITT